MVGIYFSGTGNSKYCAERFTGGFNGNSYSIEDANGPEKISEALEIVLAYPVYYSNIPKNLRDYITAHKDIWRGKKIYIIATMGMFSGDGAGVAARLLKTYGANIVGGLHVQMPDSICDESILKHSDEHNRKLVEKADAKLIDAVEMYKKNTPTKDGLGVFAHIAGLLGQRLYFYNKTREYSSKLKIDGNKCVGCGLCASICPMGNIHMEGKIAAAQERCTLCYRCANRCPSRAITLLGKKVAHRWYMEE